MGVTVPNSQGDQLRSGPNVSVEQVRALLDTLDRPVILADRNGQVLTLNDQANKCLALFGFDGQRPINLLRELFQANAEEIFQRLEAGQVEIVLNGIRAGRHYRASLRWIRESDWLAVELEGHAKQLEVLDRVAQPTVQELLQEREITYRNLLAAYLRLQEVNRQKTVFLASAAHELKTPLAVIKGYYDLLLSGSLGKLTDKQRDILQESKESSERLVRLVSMFLNYSALESGKLVLHLRENDLRDCLTELATRWHEAFVRKHVRLDTILNSDIPIFKFDYQKVQQTVANLLDNSLKHTPSGGTVTFRAELHFWERRSAEEVQTMDRRRERGL